MKLDKINFFVLEQLIRNFQKQMARMKVLKASFHNIQEAPKKRMKKQLESIEQTIEEFEVLRAKIEEENKLKRKRKARNLISKMKSDDKTESNLKSEENI